MRTSHLISLHIRSMWETTVMHKQVSGWTVNFGPNFPESPFLELKTRKPPPPILENFRFGMTKVYSGIPLHFGKLQIWDDQSLLRNTPPFRKTSDLGWPKFTLEYPPFWKTSDLGWPKFTLEYPPISENFRLGWPKFTLEYPPFWKSLKTSDLGWPKFTPEYPPHFGKLQIWDDQSLLRNTPHFGKLQIWDDQSLLWNTPPFRKTSDLGWPKFTLEYPPISEKFENFRFWMTKVYSGIPPPICKTSDLGWPKFTPEYPPPFWKTSDLGWPEFTMEYPPHFGKLQIWDDQSLLWNTPPFQKTSDLGWPKFTPEYPPPFWKSSKTSDLGWPEFTMEYPPISENFRFGMTKVYYGIPPHFGNFRFGMTKVYSGMPPPISENFENFRFGMTKVYSGIPPPFQKTSDLGWPKFTPEYPPPQWKLWESPSPRVPEYRELLHVETLSSPDNYSFLTVKHRR